MERYDAIVVGSGATGGWAALELTRAGMRVIVLEAGAPLPRLSSTWSPADHARLARQPVQSHVSRALHPALFVDDLEHPYTTPRARPYRWLRSRVLGGRTLSWNAVTLRFSELDFQPRDGGAQWPITYADLAPYYDVAERRLGVAGALDHLAPVPDGRFLPARRLTDGERLLQARVEAAWPERRIIHQRGVLPRASWKSTTSTLADAQRTGRLLVRPDSIVSRLVWSRGRVGGVACIDRISRQPFEVRAGVVVLCASTIETLRILLASELDSDALGRYVMDHTMLTIAGAMGALKRRRVLPYRGGPYGIYLPRFRNLDGARAAGFARGYGIQGVVQRWPTPTSTARGVPFQLTAFGEVLARRDNCVTLDAKRRDAWGIPIARIACRYGDNEEAMVRDQLAVFEQLAQMCDLEIDGDADWPAPGTSVHEVGGARMGSDPTSSVVDRDNRLWAAPNVLVTDGACFVSAPCQNPTLTMMALTIRACRRLVGP